MTESFVVAIKRNARNRVSHDWVDRLREVDGVEIMGYGPVRAQIVATPQAIDTLRDILDDNFHIEPVIPHKGM